MADALESLGKELGIVPSPEPVAQWCQEVLEAEVPTQLDMGPDSPDEQTPNEEAEVLADLETAPTALRDFGEQTGPTAASLNLPLRLPLEAGSALAASAPSLGGQPFPAVIVSPIATPPLADTHRRRTRVWPDGSTPPPALTEGLPRPITNHAPQNNWQWSGKRTLMLAAGVGLLLLLIALASSDDGNQAQAPATAGAPATALAAAPIEEKNGLSQIAIATAPMSAAVLIDNKVMKPPFALAEGSYQLLIRHGDYSSWSERLIVEAGVDQHIRVALARQEAPVVTGGPQTAVPTVALSASDMTKLSGPALELGATADSHTRVRVLLCVSPEGRVSSASILSNVRSSERRRIQRQLKGWRYQPPRQADAAVTACFADSIPVGR